MCEDSHAVRGGGGSRTSVRRRDKGEGALKSLKQHDILFERRLIIL